MKPRGDSILKLVLVIGAVLLLPLASYVAGYFTRTVAWGQDADQEVAIWIERY
jgi:hypothetical protein